MHYDLDKRARSCRPCAQAAYDAAQAAPPPPKYTLRECPFCGHQPEEGNLYDSVHRVNREGTLWTAGCVDNEGGCNASVLGGSREHAIALWNTRLGEDRSTIQAIEALARDTFETHEEADAWLRRPHSMLNGETPLDSSKTVLGVKRVNDILNAVKHGGIVGFLPRTIMILCPTCGNKRCPKAENSLFKCTNSNAPDQIGELDAQPSGD